MNKNSMNTSVPKGTKKKSTRTKPLGTTKKDSPKVSQSSSNTSSITSSSITSTIPSPVSIRDVLTPSEIFEPKISTRDEQVAEKSDKPVHINFALFVKRYKDLEPNIQCWSEDEQIKAIHGLSHIRLDRENICTIDGLELLGTRVTNLYLQHNRISKIENLEVLHDLLFLTLANNQIRVLEGLRQLKKLSFLDLSENLIEHLDVSELPQSIFILKLNGNPCTTTPDYRSELIKHLPRLKDLDEVHVTVTEKRLAGYEVSDSEDDDDSEMEDEVVNDEDREMEDFEQMSSLDLFRKLLDHYRDAEAQMASALNTASVFSDTAAAMKKRSQLRQQEDEVEHKRHREECQQWLTDLSIAPGARAMSAISEDSYSTTAADETGDKLEVLQLTMRLKDVIESDNSSIREHGDVHTDSGESVEIVADGTAL